MEPRRSPLFLVLLGVCVLGSVPFLFVGRDVQLVLGLPLWLWSSMGFTVALAVVTAWGMLSLWKDEEHD